MIMQNRKWILVIILLILLAINGCGIWLLGRKSVSAVATLTLKRLDQAIDLAAGYIVRNCDVNGRFTYLVNIKPGVKVKPNYNIIRHAGTIYALCMYEQSRPDEKTRQAIRRSVEYLKREAVTPIEGRPEMLAVWSKDKALVSAKLGSAGLGLVALMSTEKVLPGTTPIEELRKLGLFLLFMQKEDGSFYSKYILSSKEGRSSYPPSLYYPGEACLGLLMLYEKDPQIEWLQGAANAISHLVRVRENTGKIERDYWTLIAIAELLKYYDRCRQPISSTAILQHAASICGYVVSDAQSNFGIYPGCFTGDRRTTPTSAALEGLLAALIYLPEEYKSLKQSIASTTEAGTAFLITGQVMTGEYAGGFLAKAPDPKPKPNELGTRNSDTEIRIDYVQHALSAMLRYRKFFQEKLDKHENP